MLFNKIYKLSVTRLVLGVLLTLVFTSCKKDFLDKQAELSIPEDMTFETPERILAQVNGLYSSVKQGELFGGRYLIYNDIRAEEFQNRTSNVVTGFSSYQFTNDPSDSYIANFWIVGYLTINRINKFLADFELPENQGVVTDEVKAIYIAEAKFLRAFTYSALVQLFAQPYTLDNGASRGLPLRLTPNTTSEGNSMPSSTVAQVYTQILQDLDDAEANLPESANVTRAHKNTAIALKTRIYLRMGQYDKVLPEAEKIVSPSAPFQAPGGVTHRLAENVAAVFGQEAAQPENILSFPMDNTNAPGTQNQLGYYYNAGNIEYYLNRGAGSILSDSTGWPLTDARRLNFVENYNANWTILTKYSADPPYLDWIPAIRYAEVLLNTAEAEAEAGSLERAHALVSAVRERSDDSYTVPEFTTKEIALETIFLERRIELLGEGFRAPDIQRRLLPFNSVGAGASIPHDDSRYVFPIPTREILTNPEVE